MINLMSVSDLGKKEMNHYDPIGMKCSRSCMTRVFYTVILDIQQYVRIGYNHVGCVIVEF
jgi:hypothetical protein